MRGELLQIQFQQFFPMVFFRFFINGVCAVGNGFCSNECWFFFFSFTRIFYFHHTKFANFEKISFGCCCFGAEFACFYFPAKYFKSFVVSCLHFGFAGFKSSFCPRQETGIYIQVVLFYFFLTIILNMSGYGIFFLFIIHSFTESTNII